VYVNLYHASTLDWHLEDGTGLKIVQRTKYPWDGDITLKVSPAKTATFTLYLRIPGWSGKSTATVDGKPAPGKLKSGEYFAIHRDWQGESTVHLQLDMTPSLVEANPRVAEDYGKVAVKRGPLVYCLEQVDQEDKASVLDVALAASSGPNEGFTAKFRADILGGVVMLEHKGVAGAKPYSEEPLYRTLESTPKSETQAVDLTFVPYYAWGNRLPGAMVVWIPYSGTGKVPATKRAAESRGTEGRTKGKRATAAPES